MWAQDLLLDLKRERFYSILFIYLETIATVTTRHLILEAKDQHGSKLC